MVDIGHFQLHRKFTNLINIRLLHTPSLFHKQFHWTVLLRLVLAKICYSFQSTLVVHSGLYVDCYVPVLISILFGGSIALSHRKWFVGNDWHFVLIALVRFGWSRREACEDSPGCFRQNRWCFLAFMVPLNSISITAVKTTRKSNLWKKRTYFDLQI